MDVQARIEPPTIPLNRTVTDNMKGCDIIRIKMRWDPESYMSETYELNIDTFENVKPEELLALMNNFNTMSEGTGTMSATRSINYLHHMLRGEAIRVFDKLVRGCSSSR